MIVTELIDGFLHDEELRKLPRDESLLLQTPDPKPMNIWLEHAPIGVIHFPMTHVKGPFSPPQGVFESDYIRIEWTRMNGRQPFYHRNQDCDEITLHVNGERTVLTEIGTVDLEPGDFSMIPVGVAHDNRGNLDVHMIFYIPAPVAECKLPVRTAEYRATPYEGWDPVDCIELVTEKLSALGTDTSTFRTSERMLIDTAKTEERRLHILRADPQKEIDWLYKAENIWLGVTNITHSRGDIYCRHRFADEVQLQLKGRRTLVTQRGTVHIEPGDFITIPKGCAFANITDEECTYAVVFMRYPAEPIQPFSKKTIFTSVEDVVKLREGVKISKGAEDAGNRVSTSVRGDTAET